MDQLAAEHVAALAAMAAAATLSIWGARARPGAWIVPFARTLAVLILAAYLAEQVAIVVQGTWSLERSLPLQLTDAVTIIAALALWNPRPLLFELAYFWGLTASLQAVLTPDLDSAFPSLFFFTYFATHCGAVVAAVFLAFGCRLTPRRGAVTRVFVATAAFAAVAGLGDLLTGGNYMFLREKPDTASLLDVMGPWPWYILTGAVLAIAMFAALDVPFRARRRDHSGVAARSDPPLLYLDQNYLSGIAKRKPAFDELEPVLREAVAAGAVAVAESAAHRLESAARPDLPLLELLRELSGGRRLPDAPGARERNVERRLMRFAGRDFPERVGRDSDRVDFEALAIALPRCRLVTCDAFMADVVRRAGLDRRFGCEIYSGRRRDVVALRDRLAGLTRRRAGR